MSGRQIMGGSRESDRHTHRLRPLLEPNSIAIIGAKGQEGSSGNNVLQTCLGAGFQGSVYLVNPTLDEIDGMPCYPSLHDLPEPVDVAALVVANHRVEQVFNDVADANIPAAVVYGSCLMDEGPIDGPPLRDRILRRAVENDIRICGINGSGFMNRDACVSLQLQDIGDVTPGHICLLSQSGSVYATLVHNDGRLRFNLSVSTGQENTVELSEYMDYALELESTRAIGLFMETVRDPEAFLAVLEKAAAREVPVVVLKTARSERGKQFAASHSGAIAGNDSGFEAVFRKHGVLRVDDLDELAATLQLLTCGKRAGKGSLVAIADSGGERELLTDTAEVVGVPLTTLSDATRTRIEAEVEYGVDAENPLDAWNSGHAFDSVFRNSMELLLQDEGAAAGLWIADLHDDLSHYWSYVEGAKSIAAASQKPLAFVTCYSKSANTALVRTLNDMEVPVLEGMRPALRAIRHMFDYRDFQEERAALPPVQIAADVQASAAKWRQRLSQPETLSADETFALIGAFGVPVVASRFAGTKDAVLKAADAIGYPVALKTADRSILHKTDVGGVALSLTDRAQVEKAYERLSGSLGPAAQVSAMAAPGYELAFGLVHDPLFGPLAMIAAGGIYMETFRDAVFGLPPFDPDRAGELIEQLSIRPLLDGARGKPAADVAAIAQAFSDFSILVATLGAAVAELDINPVIADPDGVVAVDALLMQKPYSRSPT